MVEPFAVCATVPVVAKNYPTKAVRLVASFPSGSSVDVVGRILAAKLTENPGQQVIVDNRSGASGIIGTELVAKTPPGDYIVLINTLPRMTNERDLPNNSKRVLPRTALECQDRNWHDQSETRREVTGIGMSGAFACPTWHDTKRAAVTG